jgi:hypothetical protein
VRVRWGRRDDLGKACAAGEPEGRGKSSPGNAAGQGRGRGCLPTDKRLFLSDSRRWSSAISGLYSCGAQASRKGRTAVWQRTPPVIGLLGRARGGPGAHGRTFRAPRQAAFVRAPGGPCRTQRLFVRRVRGLLVRARGPRARTRGPLVRLARGAAGGQHIPHRPREWCRRLAAGRPVRRGSVGRSATSSWSVAEQCL